MSKIKSGIRFINGKNELPSQLGTEIMLGATFDDVEQGSTALRHTNQHAVSSPQIKWVYNNNNNNKYFIHTPRQYRNTTIQHYGEQ